jgi:hypothetical protein
LQGKWEWALVAMAAPPSSCIARTHCCRFSFDIFHFVLLEHHLYCKRIPNYMVHSMHSI